MSNTTRYTAEDILYEDYDDDDIEVLQQGKITDTWRWGTCHQTVVRMGDELWAVDYRTQPEEGVQDHSDLYRVVAKKVTTIKYVPAQGSK